MDEKLSLLQDLISLSKVDNDISYMESHFIKAIAKDLGVSEKEMEYLKNKPVSSIVQKSETDRITQFYRLILLMSIDQQKREEEIQFCKTSGMKLGLNPIGVNEILKKVIASKTGMLPVNEIINIFKTSHN